MDMMQISIMKQMDRMQSIVPSAVLTGMMDSSIAMSAVLTGMMDSSIAISAVLTGMMDSSKKTPMMAA
jgi:hypothetical protein